MQLLIEQALAAYITQEGILPSSYRLYPAHGVEVLDATLQDYLRIVASGPRAGGLSAGGNYEIPVEFQLFTGGIEDQDKVPAVLPQHDALIQSLYDLWNVANFDYARTALNVPIVDGISFTGWEATEPDDGRTETQLVARLKYLFDAYLV